mmetsp:Transcript_9992/g.9933  ORF Transcript_9992/g.9933 Transcript_9992/m.9933 type:complete len:193 (+) Transcript_9992:256-834(+)
MVSLGNRQEFLHDYFDKETSFLIKFYITRKTKKAKAIVKKLNLIDNAVRNKILKIYMEKCLFEYGIKFNNWRVKVFGEDKGLEPDELAGRLEALKKKEEKLYLNTEIIDEDGTASASRQTQVDQGDNNAPNQAQKYLFMKRKEKEKEKGKEKEKEKGNAIPPPIFLMMPSKDELHKMIIRATQFSHVSEMEF